MRATCLTAAILLVSGHPLQAQDSLYDRAVAARLADQPDLAGEMLEEWLADHPGDADALLQYGYALLAQDRLDEAERAFRQVLAIAPQYADAHEGLAILAERRAAPYAERRGSLLLEGAVSDLEGDQGGWHELVINASLPVGDNSSLDVRGAWLDRFGAEDTEFAALLTHRTGVDVWLRFGASATPSADFRPEAGLTAGLDYRLGSNTIASVDGSWQRFPLQDVWTLRPGIARYFGGGRYALTLQGNLVAVEGDRTLLGGSVRADYIPSDRTRLFLGIASGPETDLGQVRDATTLFGGGELPVSESISLLGSVAHDWRDLGADRTEGRVGVKFVL